MQRLFITFCIIILACSGNAQDFSGSFTSSSEDESTTLTLKKGPTGKYTGSLESGGITLPVNGEVKNKILSGTIDDDGFAFQAEWRGNQLSFTLFELDEFGTPIAETNETIMFQRTSGSKTSAEKSTGKSKGDVLINDVPLSKEQIVEIEKTYGVKPKPGNYWYDAKSGLYGVVGYPAYGYMQPDHRFGSMKKNASNGNTGIFINGRELPALEYTVWSYMVGSWIQPGRYWLDHQGNAGYEGNPTPVINLFVAAQQNGYQGQGGSGDNFWTSRFSAGNYDSGGQRGYVSVPGHGPVGYGF